MPTKRERNALVFLAAMAALGVAMRVWQSSQRIPLPPPAPTALTRQIAAVDSVRSDVRSGVRPARGRRGLEGGARRTKSGRASDGPSSFAPSPLPTSPGRLLVDVDWATATALTKLPGIGPAIAGRIIADRDAHGPFGCMAALRTVKGVGPVLARTLDSLVSFSGPSHRDLTLCPR